MCGSYDAAPPTEEPRRPGGPAGPGGIRFKPRARAGPGRDRRASPERESLLFGVIRTQMFIPLTTGHSSQWPGAEVPASRAAGAPARAGLGPPTAGTRREWAMLQLGSFGRKSDMALSD